MEELISIVVPVYNVEKYLPRCIESIIKQSYKNLEILLVEDGSPDSCPSICDDYAKKDKRIKVIHKVNGGLSDARNVGIEVSTGKYLGFVDSDDYIHPEMYERLLELLKSNDADIAMCDLKMVYHENYEVDRTGNDEVKIYDRQQVMRALLDKYLHVMCVVSCGKLYKKELFETIRFPKGKLHEDEFTTYKLFWKSEKVVGLSSKFYYYFQRNDSIMGKRKKQFSYDGLEAYEQMAEFFENAGEKEIFYLVKYKYLYMLREAAAKLKREKDNSKAHIVKELDKIFRRECDEHIHGILGWKRKIRLLLYRYFRIDL